MRLNWLFGPRVTPSSPLGAWYFGDLTINVTDLADIVAIVDRGCSSPVSITRAEVGLGESAGAGDPIGVLKGGADTDLSAVRISGYDEVSLAGIEIRLGARIPAIVQITTQDASQELRATALRVVERIESEGKRRIPRWKMQQFAAICAVALLAGSWLSLVASTQRWDVLVLATATAVAFWWQMRLRIPGSSAQPAGYVRIDATDREQVRINRATERRDWRVGIPVAIISIVGTVIFQRLFG